MNDACFALAEQLVSPSYIGQARQARQHRESMVKSLLAQRRMPEQGWDEGTLRLFLQELALMDSNTFVGSAGVGEREARVICPIVQQRHFGLGHGVGRSGDIAEEQPKAAGSSLLYKLTNALAHDALRRAGATAVTDCLVLPLATGMTIMLVLLALRQTRPTAQYVIWPRIDQKSCLKAVSAAGCQPVVIENLLEGDELRTDVDAIRAKVAELGAENVLCVLATTSCFAPRGVDKLLEIARLCKEQQVPHLVNNAYGVQCEKCMKALTAASRHGRLDLFIQSTDKNFLVPVGGAVVASASKEYGRPLLKKVSATYPGRASVAPILDLFCTLLHLGADGWTQLLAERQRLMPLFREKLQALAEKHGERVLETPNNTISMAVTLSPGARPPTSMGGALFVRLISGARIVAPAKPKAVAGLPFTNYGAHHDAYPHVYLTVACALGITQPEIDLFLKKLDKTFAEYKAADKKAAAAAAAAAAASPADAPPTAAAAAAPAPAAPAPTAAPAPAEANGGAAPERHLVDDAVDLSGADIADAD